MTLEAKGDSVQLTKSARTQNEWRGRRGKGYRGTRLRRLQQGAFAVRARVPPEGARVRVGARARARLLLVLVLALLRDARPLLAEDLRNLLHVGVG
eukprot:6192872-Pleurochrysis_carterae.AAC.8